MGGIENATITYAFVCSALRNKVGNQKILWEQKKRIFWELNNIFLTVLRTEKLIILLAKRGNDLFLSTFVYSKWVK